MNPDVDGPITTETGPNEIDMKQILLAQDQMLKAQASKIADLEKQIGALAARPAAAPAAPAEESHQDRAWHALCKEYGIKED